MHDWCPRCNDRECRDIVPHIGAYTTGTLHSIHMGCDFDDIHPVGIRSGANAESAMAGGHGERRILIDGKTTSSSALETHHKIGFDDRSGFDVAESLDVSARGGDRLRRKVASKAPAQSLEEGQKVEVVDVGGGIVQRGWSLCRYVDGGHQHRYKRHVHPRMLSVRTRVWSRLQRQSRVPYLVES